MGWKAKILQFLPLRNKDMIKVLQDPLGGWCVASHINGSLWSIIEGKIDTKRNAQAWLNRYKQTERLYK